MARGLIAEVENSTNTPSESETDQAVNKRHAGFQHPKLIVFLLLVALALLPFLIVQQIVNADASKIYTSLQAVPTKPVAIVFGAGVTINDTPGLMLASRLDAGISLYKNGKVQSLIMTGGDVEVTIMRRYAENRGVPANAIKIDSEGLRTYDSCYRASHDFNITDAVLVTQQYHLPRALYLCNSLGIQAVGFKAADSVGQNDWNNFREFFAQLDSWYDINISQPKPPADKTSEK